MSTRLGYPKVGDRVTLMETKHLYFRGARPVKGDVGTVIQTGVRIQQTFRHVRVQFDSGVIAYCPVWCLGGEDPRHRLKLITTVMAMDELLSKA